IKPGKAFDGFTQRRRNTWITRCCRPNIGPTPIAGVEDDLATRVAAYCARRGGSRFPATFEKSHHLGARDYLGEKLGALYFKRRHEAIQNTSLQLRCNGRINR